MALMSNTIMTIGYEAGDVNNFITRLQTAGIQRVIDTRYLPSSRKKGLSKGPLSERLAALGIDYVHLREVGTPKPWRDEYKRDHDFEKLARRYRPYLEERLDVLKHIHDLAGDRPSALMCYEAEPHLCHRSLIGHRLAELFDTRVVDL